MPSEIYDDLISETWTPGFVHSGGNVEDDDQSDEVATEQLRDYFPSALSELIQRRGNVGTVRFWYGVNTLRNLSEPHIRYLNPTGGQFGAAIIDPMTGQF